MIVAVVAPPNTSRKRDSLLWKAAAGPLQEIAFTMDFFHSTQSIAVLQKAQKANRPFNYVKVELNLT